MRRPGREPDVASTSCTAAPSASQARGRDHCSAVLGPARATGLQCHYVADSDIVHESNWSVAEDSRTAAADKACCPGAAYWCGRPQRRHLQVGLRVENMRQGRGGSERQKPLGFRVYGVCRVYRV